MANISVFGAGGWGTALAVTAANAGHRVTLWSAFAQEIEAIRRDGEHRRLLPGVLVPSTVTLTTDPSCAKDADLILLAVPSFAIEETARKLQPFVKADTLVANAGKGIEEHTFRRFTQVIEQVLPVTAVALSGPSHAEEVGKGVPTLLVAASRDPEKAERVQQLLSNDTLRIYTADDVVGVELGGALKNVIALSVGICDGLKMGDNTKAALMTRGLAEIARLGVKMGANATTFAGLSGMGDLIVTCNSMYSRNRRAGILIGQGVAPADAVKQVGTVEGYLAAETAYRLSVREGVAMPITETCYRICYEQYPPERAASALMQRPTCKEEQTVWF